MRGIVSKIIVSTGSIAIFALAFALLFLSQTTFAETIEVGTIHELSLQRLYPSSENIDNSNATVEAAPVSTDIKIKSDVIHLLACGKGVVFSRSPDGGKTFTQPTSVFQSSSECANPQITFFYDSILAFWTLDSKLYLSKSMDNGLTWLPEKMLFNFMERPKHLRFAANKSGVLYIIWTDASDDLFFTSYNDNTEFPRPLMISNQTGPASSAAGIKSGLELDANKDYLIASWHDEKSRDVKYCESFNSGKSWTKPGILVPSSQAPENFKLKVSGNGVFASYCSRSEPDRKKLYYLAKLQADPAWSQQRIITETTNPIDNLDFNISEKGTQFLSWTSQNQMYAARSIDDGQSWHSIKNYLLPATGNIEDFRCLISSSTVIACLNSKEFFAVENSAPAEARILTADNIAVNSILDLKFDYPTNPDADKFLYTMEISEDKLFSQNKTLSFPARNTEFKISEILKDGSYFYRITAWDGLNLSRGTAQGFIVDSISPVLNITLPNNSGIINANASEETICGTTEKGSVLTVNNTEVLTDLNGFFNFRVLLTPGLNTVTIEAKDPAQNKTTATRIFNYKNTPCEILITKPAKGGWFKQGAAIAFEAALQDNAMIDIEDETEAAIEMNGITLEGSAGFDKSLNKIVGFVQLPKDLSFGENRLFVFLPGRNGNIIKAQTAINIDIKGPSCFSGADGDTVFSNKTDKIQIPLADEGSGIDLDNSLIKVYRDGITIEGQTLPDKAASSLIFVPNDPLAEDKYTLEITARDLAGNTAPVKVVTLSIGGVSSSANPISGMTVSGGSAIGDIASCPNPFNPDTQNTALTYNISKDSAIQAYIFDTKGCLVYKTDINGSTGYNSNLIWNGKSMDGALLPNGAYIVHIVAIDSSGASSSSRSRVIILR